MATLISSGARLRSIEAILTSFESPRHERITVPALAIYALSRSGYEVFDVFAAARVMLGAVSNGSGLYRWPSATARRGLAKPQRIRLTTCHRYAPPPEQAGRLSGRR